MINWKRVKRSTIGLVPVLALSLALSGCGGSGEAGETPPAGTGEKTQETKPKAEDPASVKGEVVWQYPNTTWPEPEIKNMIADFNKTYPNVTVKPVLGPLEPMIAAGNPPNVATNNRLEANWIMDGMFEELTPYIKRDPDYKPETLFHQVLYEIPQFEKGQYGIPMYSNPTYALVVNNKIMNQYGEKSIPNLQGLKDTDEFYKKFWIMKNGEYEMTGENPLFYYGNLSGLFFVSYLNGADPSTFWNPETKKVNFNDPKIVDALDWLAKFNLDTINQPAYTKLKGQLPKNTHPFLAEKQAMMIITSNNLKDFRKAKPDLDLTVLPAPQASLWNGGSNLAIVKAGKDKDAAWAFIKWMTSTEQGSESLYTRLGLLSPMKSSKYLEEKAKTDADLKVFLDINGKAKKWIPQFPVAYDTEYKKLFPDFLAGKVTAKEMMDHVNKEVQKRIDEFYASKKK
ncbi:extracellular solute-binding protein [Paenibacillus flagellatus]|nr:extracellular solute-binding protein [Paenibacillus flagellatus]